MSTSTSPAPARRVLPWLRRIAVVVVLTCLAFLGGVVATHLFPVHTETRYFSADIQVQPTWDSTAALPTVLGDMEVTFDGPLPAPGLTAQVQVRETVNELLRSGTLRTADLQPTSAELQAAIRGGVTELAWKFTGGALATTTLALFAITVTRPRRTGAALLAAGASSALALTGPGLAAWTAYSPDRVSEFRTTSLLSLVENNTDLLRGLDEKADQGAVYVTNLLALSSALRQEFNPADTTPVAARFLLVSDLHGLNQYPLMAEIIRSQEIDAVIDTGDLVNFGRPDEGELTHLYRDIENLGVPYLFVRGNHDATGPEDEAVLRRLSRIPNVMLLEPTRDDYQVVTVNGVTVSGFNDARWFNQSGIDTAEQQLEIVERFREAADGAEPTDILATHQPYAALRAPSAGVSLAGHFHVAGLDGSTITIPSFTGGGLVNQFRLPPLTDEAREAAEEDPETAGELQGKPYGFDILTFDESCAVSTLTRYSYRNLVSGRPQFDDVSLINGRTLQPDPPQDRTCGSGGTTVQPLAELRDAAGAGTQAPEPTPVPVSEPDDEAFTDAPTLDLPLLDDAAATTGPGLPMAPEPRP